MYGCPVNVTVLLSEEPLSLDAAFRAVLRPDCGGTALFVGTTRSPNQGRDVDELEYEAYAEAARPELERIGRETAGRHDHARLGGGRWVGVPEGDMFRIGG